MLWGVSGDAKNLGTIERASEKNCAELRARPVKPLYPKVVKPALCELVDSPLAAEAA